MDSPAQRIMEIIVDTADLTTYVRLPMLRNGRWTMTKMDTLIRVAAKRAEWRESLELDLKRLNGDSNE